MSRSSVSVVCDAGPLIHLDEWRSISLLSDFEEVLVPEVVWQEVAHHRPSPLANPDVSLQKIGVTLSPEAALQSLVASLALDQGEQAALTLLQTYPIILLFCWLV